MLQSTSQFAAVYNTAVSCMFRLFGLLLPAAALESLHQGHAAGPLHGQDS